MKHKCPDRGRSPQNLVHPTSPILIRTRSIRRFWFESASPGSYNYVRVEGVEGPGWKASEVRLREHMAGGWEIEQLPTGEMS